MSGALARGYELRLERAEGSVSAMVNRAGPANPLQVGVGRHYSDALKIAGWLFPICPRAHVGAALGAIERAAGIELSVGQQAAREAIVLAEAVSGCIWRGALVWTDLLGAAPMHGPVQRARQASEALVHAIYPAGWAQAGGQEMGCDHDAIREAFTSLSRGIFDIVQTEASLVGRAEKLGQHQRLDCHPALGAWINDLELVPETGAGEETPRSVSDPDASHVSLEDWFIAQIDHALSLVAQLRDALSRVHDTAPVSCADDVTGIGLGISLTARGRLRHIMELQDGKLAAWHSAAPTDWNLARGGPLESYAAALGHDDPSHVARWLVAALDPCAPCQVVIVPERAHA